MNTAKAGRREQNGLIIWKAFERQLSEKELQKEIVSLENEGFQVVKVKNSDTVIVAVTSEGLAYSTSRLLKIGYEWERVMETHNQLNSTAQLLARTGMIHGEEKLRGVEGLRNTVGTSDSSVDNDNAKFQNS